MRGRGEGESLFFWGTEGLCYVVRWYHAWLWKRDGGGKGWGLRLGRGGLAVRCRTVFFSLTKCILMTFLSPLRRYGVRLQ